ncbi:YheT family hydrolase [Flagellimonas lutaonensis]|uniref:Alpha/beta hydrolase fold protein n=1 Tax=Flagellimonas lutaonensis TaxID=516051 RepID=A0A0D5YSL0_9FLAO|nr:alpha/beta fold hydrolase [Allomuricauda lutaonensis]AKA34841.1 Alpha/beta hydrolase fold protein [Allomuricauda lutaonensis]
MPLVPADYRPPFLFRNGHFSTIYHGLFRKVNGLVQRRERLELPDGDFLDLDWSESAVPTQKAVVLLHGLEGDAQRPYITGSAKYLNQYGFDACAVNFRGCSGEPNRKYRSYHSGATEDLVTIVHHLLNQKPYSEIFLMGYSLGGNVALKYLGEGNPVPKQIKGAVTVSVPCDLHDACIELLKPKNILYARRFKKHLIAKLKEKHRMFPEKISKEQIKSIVTLKDFDDVYTGPAHGFKCALDYYRKCSSKQFLVPIQIPSLIINAKNDSFLGHDCYPFREAEKNPNLHLEIPDFGGHVGFWGAQNVTYAERRAVAFFSSI